MWLSVRTEVLAALISDRSPGKAVTPAIAVRFCAAGPLGGGTSYDAPDCCPVVLVVGLLF